MPWIKKEYDCGQCIVTVKCFSSRYGSKGQILHYRSKESTKEKQQAVNDRNAMLRYSILANTNFKTGDYFITYTFKKGAMPATIAECKAIWKKYRRKLRNYYKRLGKQFKYIYVFEYEGVRPHFHILMNNDDINIKNFPKWEYGTPHIEILDDRDYHTIGDYFVKVSYEENRKKGMLGSSRNLYRPAPKITVLSSPSWNTNPKAKEGYKIDNETLINGYIEMPQNGFSFRYQSYVMVRLE